MDAFTQFHSQLSSRKLHDAARDQIACLVFWIWGFRQESEDRITVTGHRWDPSQMERLTSQLDSINAALERLSRR